MCHLQKAFDSSLSFLSDHECAKGKIGALEWMDPWGTPALISAQDEFWPFKTVLCFLLVEKIDQKRQ